MAATIPDTPTARTFAGRDWASRLAPEAGERLVLAFIVLTFGALVALAGVTRHPVDWLALGGSLLAGFGMMALAGITRLSHPRVADGAFATGAFVTMGNVVGTLVLLRFPMSDLHNDLMLASLDRLVSGYHWPTAVGWTAEVPWVGALLSFVYRSALFELFALFIMLAAWGQRRELIRAQVASALSLAAAVIIWWSMPTLGPSILTSLDPEIMETASLVVGPQYQAAMLTLARDGAPIAGPQHALGVIAFPSYHAVMAVVCVWYARRTPVFPLMVLLNTLMVPATLVHGAHHAIDVVAGVCVAGVAIWLATWMVPSRTETGAEAGSGQRQPV